MIPLSSIARRFSALSATLALAFLLMLVSACGSGDGARKKGDGTIQIAFLTMQLRPTFDEFFLPLFREFEAMNPGVEIQWLDYPYQGYETKIMTSFLSKNAPDVINLGSETIVNFTGSDLLLDLEALLPPEVVGSYLPNVIDGACRIDGTLYALPWYLAGSVTFYNKDLFDKAGIPLDPIPTSYSDLVPMMEPMRQATEAFTYFPLYTESGAMRGYWIEAGVPLLDATGTRAAFNTPRGLEIFEFWTNLYINRQVPSEALTAMHRRPIELYKTGRLAVLETGPQFLRQIKSDTPEIYESTVVGPDLGWPDTDTHILVLQVLTVSAESKHPEMAAKFAAFVTNAKNQLEFCKQTVILPSVTEALDDPYFTTPEDTVEGRARLYSARIARTGAIPPKVPHSKPLFKILDDATEAVALGKIPAKQALDDIEKQWNRILAEEEKR